MHLLPTSLGTIANLSEEMYFQLRSAKAPLNGRTPKMVVIFMYLQSKVIFKLFDQELANESEY